MTFDLLAAFAAGYFLGGIPFAAWLARSAGKDIFSTGSGNMGSMNTVRNVGVGPGIAVLLLDVGKGTLASMVGLQMAAWVGADLLTMGLSAGVGAVVGHAWSPYVGFRGGKALASAFGMTLPLMPLAGIAALVLLVALILLTRRATFGTMLTLVLFPFLTGAVLVRLAWSDGDVMRASLATAGMAVVSLIKHARAAARD